MVFAVPRGLLVALVEPWNGSVVSSTTLVYALLRKKSRGPPQILFRICACFSLSRPQILGVQALLGFLGDGGHHGGLILAVGHAVPLIGALEHGDCCLALIDELAGHSGQEILAFEGVLGQILTQPACKAVVGLAQEALAEAPVSMNLWGFGKSFLDEAEQRFAGWLTENLPKNPLKCEYFLPLVVTELIEEGKAKIQVLRSTDKWYGVTYREDKPLVVEAIARKTAEGQYPENLWA